MSLLKLLSAGKSLVGVKNTESPYRMRAANLLPKFGSPKNPFESLPKTEPLRTTPKSTSDSSPSEEETESLFESRPKPASAPTPASSPAKPAATQQMKFEPRPASPAPAAKSGKGRSLAGLVKKLNPLAYLPKRQPGAKSSRIKPERSPVQGELSLEKVRVIRNELNDSDLEIIAPKPLKNRGVSGTMTTPLPRPRLTTWGRVTSRVFGTVETQAQ